MLYMLYITDEIDVRIFQIIIQTPDLAQILYRLTRGEKTWATPNSIMAVKMAADGLAILIL